MIKLVIVRHGRSQGNEKGIIDYNKMPEKPLNHLSIEGRKQALELVNKLEKYNFDVAIVSQLVRTKETLEPYLKGKKIPLEINKLTNERDLGVFGGMDKKVYGDYCKKQGIEYGAKPENGESAEDVYKRAKKFLGWLKKNYEGKTVLLCGHFTFLRRLLNVINNEDFNLPNQHNNMKNGEVREFEI